MHSLTSNAKESKSDMKSDSCSAREKGWREGRETILYVYYMPPRGGGYSRFQVTGKIEGRKVVKFDKYFFGGWLGLSRDFWLFWTIWRFLIVPAHPGHVVLRLKYNQTCFLFWRFLRLRNSVWDFWGVNFWCRDFFLVLILAQFDHSCHLKSGVPPPGTIWVLVAGKVRFSSCLVLQ